MTRTSIPLSSPVFDGDEERNVQLAMQQGLVATNGDFILHLESSFGHRLKTHQLVALNSGTSSIHLALILLGVSHGDEVICQSFTFCASANPIAYLGAVPVFVDSEKSTWNICPEILEDTILSRISKGKKPKAIISVDLFGMPAKYEEILAVANKYNIPVVEDAAEAVGSYYRNKPCGTFGDLGIYSFNGNKIITSGGGGGLISSNTETLARARYYAMQAREKVHYYEHCEVGFNYRMSNLSAGIGLAQLSNLDRKVEKRRRIYDNYQLLLSHCKGIQLLDEPDGVFANRWLTTILIDPILAGFSNEDIRQAFYVRGIESRLLWKPLHMQPVFQDFPYYGGNVASDLFNRGLCLPSSENLTLRDQIRIVDVIEKHYQKVL